MLSKMTLGFSPLAAMTTAKRFFLFLLLHTKRQEVKSAAAIYNGKEKKPSITFRDFFLPFFAFLCGKSAVSVCV